MTYLLELIDSNTVKASTVVIAASPQDALRIAAEGKREFLLFAGLPVVSTHADGIWSPCRVFLPGKLYPHVGIFEYNKRR